MQIVFFYFKMLSADIFYPICFYKMSDSKNCVLTFVYQISDGCIVICRLLTHLSLAFHKRDSGKQCRPRSDATERGVWSGSRK